MAADPRPAATTVRYVVLGGFVLLAAVPVYVYLEPQWRPLVSRLVAALVLGMAMLELRAILVGRLARLEPSPLDSARLTPAPQPGPPQRLLELTASLRTGLRSRRHFEKVLWPRLVALAAGPLVPPPRRRGRGPSLAALRKVIGAIEDQR